MKNITATLKTPGHLPPKITLKPEISQDTNELSYDNIAGSSGRGERLKS